MIWLVLWLCCKIYLELYIYHLFPRRNSIRISLFKNWFFLSLPHTLSISLSLSLTHFHVQYVLSFFHSIALIRSVLVTRAKRLDHSITYHKQYFKMNLAFFDISFFSSSSPNKRNIFKWLNNTIYCFHFLTLTPFVYLLKKVNKKSIQIFAFSFCPEIHHWTTLANHLRMNIFKVISSFLLPSILFHFDMFSLAC